MKLYCPSCLQGTISGPPGFKPKLYTNITEQKVYTAKYQCSRCSTAFWGRSKLLTKEEAADTIRDMIRKLEGLTLLLRRDRLGVKPFSPGNKK